MNTAHINEIQMTLQTALSLHTTNFYLQIFFLLFNEPNFCRHYSRLSRVLVSCLTDIARINSHLFGTVTDHALPRLATALNCCLLNSDTFLFHVYLRMMALMPLTVFALADCY